MKFINKILLSIYIWYCNKWCKAHKKLHTKDIDGEYILEDDIKSDILEYIKYLKIEDFLISSEAKEVFLSSFENNPKFSYKIEMSSFVDGGWEDAKRIAVGSPKSPYTDRYFVYLTCNIKARYNTKILMNVLTIMKDDTKLLAITKTRERDKKINQLL